MTARWMVIVKAVSLSVFGLLALLIFAGMSTSGRAGEASTLLSINAVNPATVSNDLDTAILITGTNFTRAIFGTSEQLPTVTLNTTDLAEVSWLSSTMMIATVPWGLDPGTFTLTVTNPDGQSASLADAITVTQGIGVWTSDGPYGGVVTSILIDPTTTETVYATMQSYAASSGIGLFRSRNQGDWELVLGDIGNQYHSVDLSAGGTPSLYAQKWDQGIVRSDDGGDHWTVLPFPHQGCSDLRPFASLDNPQVVYVTTDCIDGAGLYRSENRGETWTAINTGITDTQVTAFAIDPGNPQILIAGTHNGNLFRSIDGGASWILAGKPDNFISDLAINPFGEHETWAAGADSSGHWGFLWRYLAGEWAQVMPGAGGENQAVSIKFSPTISGTMWIATYQGAFKSIDGGSTWQALGGPSLHTNALAIDPADSETLYVGYSGEGIARTLDGGASWKEVNEGLAGVYPNGIAVHPQDPAIVYVTAHGIGGFKSYDGGDSWLEMPVGDPVLRAPVIDPNIPSRVYIMAGSGVRVTDNEGVTWHEVRIDPPPAYAACCNVDALSMLSLAEPGRLILGAGFLDQHAASTNYAGGGIYTSDDYGETWEFVVTPEALKPVAVLTTSTSQHEVVYAGMGSCCSGPGGGIWKSEDGGQTWSSLGLSNSQITGLAVDPSDAQRIFAASLHQLYTSNDGGLTWTLLATQAAGMDKLLAAPTIPTTLYRYGWLGMMRSIDGGMHWQRASGSLGMAKINALAATSAEGRVILYAGASGGEEPGNPAQAHSGEVDISPIQAGVYRNTLRIPSPRLYLPVVKN